MNKINFTQVMFWGIVLFIGNRGFSVSQSLSKNDCTMVSTEECAKVFHWADDCEQFKSPDGQQYYVAWNKGYGDDPDVILGYVFPKTIVYKTDTLNILIGVETSDRIHKVIALSNTFIVPRDFLLQFYEKGIQDSFGIVRTADDLLSVPSKIKPIHWHEEISQMFADSVKEAVVSANLILAEK